MRLGRLATMAVTVLAVSAGLFSSAPAASADTVVPPPPALSRDAIPNDPSPSICYNAYVQGIGWQGWKCNGDVAGTVGQSLRIEALAVEPFNMGGICAWAHVQNIGWLPGTCWGDGQSGVAGAAGSGLRMEALQLSTLATVEICGDAQVQDIGWQGQRCNTNPQDTSIILGTTGQSLRMEAVQIWAPVNV
jgi:uncharacterized protein YjdB